jgi:nitroreductase
VKDGYLLKLFRVRRSIRRYSNKKIEPQKIKILKEILQKSPNFANSKYFFYFIETNKLRKKFVKAVTSGIFNKINLWLLRYDIPYFVVAGGYENKGLKVNDKNLYLLDVCVALEYLVLCAFELGLGTCWLGAFNEKEIKKLLNLKKEQRIVAITPLGYPETGDTRMDFGKMYDDVARNFMHRRKDIEELIYYENF